MDLSALDTSGDTTATLALCHPGTGAELLDEESSEPVTITVVGQDSPDYIKARHEQQTKRIQRASTVGRVNVTGEQIDADGLALTVMCVKSWKHIVLDGERLECTPLNVRRLFTRLPWVREQVDTFINDRSNFLGNSSGTSSSTPQASSN